MSAFLELVILPAVLPLLVTLLAGWAEAWLDRERSPHAPSGIDPSFIKGHSA